MAKNYNDPDNYTITMHRSNYKHPDQERINKSRIRFEERLENNLKPKDFEYLAKQIVDKAIKLFLWDKDFSYLSIALKFAVPAFELAEECLHKNIESKIIKIEKYGEFIAMNPKSKMVNATEFWFKSMSLAHITNNTNAISRLSKISPSIFTGLEYRIILAKCWQNIGEGNLKSEFEIATKLAKKRKLTHGSKIGLYAELLDIPFIETIQAINQTNRSEIDEILSKALRNHRLFYDTKRGLNRGDLPLKDEFRGIFPINLIGIYFLVLNKFGQSKVKSGYIPNWLLTSITQDD